MDEQEFLEIAAILRDAGEYEKAEKVEEMAEAARKDAAQYRCLAKESAWEDYGIADEGGDYYDCPRMEG